MTRLDIATASYAIRGECRKAAISAIGLELAGLRMLSIFLGVWVDRAIIGTSSTLIQTYYGEDIRGNG